MRSRLGALRGLSTAGLRRERQCQNALGLATALRGHPAVLNVRYPGLPDDPSYSVVSSQMRRAGGLLAIELADAGRCALVRHSELLVAATSFGGIHLRRPTGSLGRPGCAGFRPHRSRHRGHGRPGGGCPAGARCPVASLGCDFWSRFTDSRRRRLRRTQLRARNLLRIGGQHPAKPRSAAI